MSTTDHTNHPTAIAEALERFFPGLRTTVRAGASGMNNTTRFVDCGGSRYVLRVYETHRDAKRVAYEHAVLSALARLELPFRTPIPASTPDGVTLVRASDGKLAAMFRYVEGDAPTLAGAPAFRSFGRAIGQLSAALRDVQVAGDPVYPPYYELDAAYPSCTPDAVARLRDAPPPPLERAAGAIRRLVDELDSLRRALPSLRTLPHQTVHGDLNASNALAAPDGTIAAVLDFEFATRDVRAMEIAVCLSDLLNPDKDETEMHRDASALLQGFADVVRLEPEEIAAIPTLLRLRRLDVFLHFLSRYWDGVDEAAGLLPHIESADRLIRWLDARQETMVELLSALRP